MRYPSILLAALVLLVILGNNFASYQSWKKGGYRRLPSTNALARMALAAAR